MLGERRKSKRMRKRWTNIKKFIAKGKARRDGRSSAHQCNRGSAQHKTITEEIIPLQKPPQRPPGTLPKTLPPTNSPANAYTTPANSHNSPLTPLPLFPPASSPRYFPSK